MSIIEEALRRVQEPLPNPSSKAAAKSAPAAIEAPPAPAPPASSTAHSWQVETSAPRDSSASQWSSYMPALVAAVIAIFAIALIAGTVIWIRGLSLAASRSLPATNNPSVATQEPSLEAVQQPVVVPPSATVAKNLSLSGVVHGFGESYAMIGSGIFTIGQRVDEKTITEIGENWVKLRDDAGNESTLILP
ncbi:MAG: hypothetical protein HYY57_02550 [Candidatus Omnitrophica bacterium]|nr:hypothetical protein [Candidatus Omnitrophota bacterium]